MFKEMLGESFALLEKFAPSIASAIGSPAAGTATMFGLNLLSSAFGVPANNLGSALTTSHDCSDRLCQLEETFGQWFKNNSGQIRLPSTVEIKISWNDS